MDDEIRRREEEELQRVLEMSVHDKGGRSAWKSYDGDFGTDSGGAGPSSSKQTANTSTQANTSAAPSPSTQPKNDYGGARYASGYVPARTPPPKAQSPPPAAVPAPAANPVVPIASTPVSYAQAKTSSQTSLPLATVSRVRALHSFEGAEQGELTFEKGDIIKVVDRNYKDWWRGQLRGRTGIFPVNYVVRKSFALLHSADPLTNERRPVFQELLPDPTPDEIAKEAEQEAAVFAQAANIDKLLSMLRGLDPAKDNLADDDEIQVSDYFLLSIDYC